jgi:hypothetical protein
VLEKLEVQRAIEDLKGEGEHGSGYLIIGVVVV